MTANDFRRLALGLEGVIEAEHMDHPDFRVGGKIFATLQPGLRRAWCRCRPRNRRASSRTRRRCSSRWPAPGARRRHERAAGGGRRRDVGRGADARLAAAHRADARSRSPPAQARKPARGRSRRTLIGTLESCPPPARRPTRARCRARSSRPRPTCSRRLPATASCSRRCPRRSASASCARCRRWTTPTRARCAGWPRPRRGRRKSRELKRDDQVLDETGIRALRRKPVFTTPNVFPPEQLRAAGRPRRRGAARSRRAAALLRLQAEVHGHPSLLRSALPGVRRVQLRASAPSWPTCAAAWRCSPAAA